LIARFKNQICLENDSYLATDTYIHSDYIYSSCLGNDKLKLKIPKIPTLCACGCNEVVWNGKHYSLGHNSRVSNPAKSPEARAKLKARKLSDEQINRLIAINTGSKRSDATKLLMSIAKKGKKVKPFSEQHKDNIAKARQGKKLSEEHIKNLSLSHMGNEGFWNGKKRPELSENFKGEGNPSWGRKQSIETITKRIKRGDEHYNWQGGITPETRRRTRGLLWRQIADRIRLRDNNTCQVCGKFGNKKKLPVHHIIPFKISKNNDDTNLVVVCEPHHTKLDALYYANKNRDYWECFFMDLLKKRGLLL